MQYTCVCAAVSTSKFETEPGVIQKMTRKGTRIIFSRFEIKKLKIFIEKMTENYNFSLNLFFLLQ